MFQERASDEEISSKVLEVGDEMIVDVPSRCATTLMQILARFPLTHSVTWLIVVLYAAIRETSARNQLILKIIIEAWLLYSFGKYMITGVTSLYGLQRLRENDAKRADWWAQDAKSSRDEKNIIDEIKYEDVIHVVIIPNYKESVATLRRTLGTLAWQRDACEQLVVVLAMEARDPLARSTAASLENEFSTAFRSLFTTLHVLKSGEVGGKSSNENWAARCAKYQLVDTEKIDPSRIIFTVCDADTYFHPSYFGALSHAYVTANPQVRANSFWQGATQFYPNSDQVPLLCKVRYALLSVGFLGQLANPLHYRLPFAVYSLSLDLVLKAGYWDPAVIPEDWHMFLRAFYATKGTARVLPLFFPIGCDCVIDKTPFKTLYACYQQATRWQWGAIDIGFIAVHSTCFTIYTAYKQIAVTLAASEHHLYYPLMWIVIAAAPWLVDDWATGWRFQLWLAFFISNFFFLNLLDTSYRQILSTSAKIRTGRLLLASRISPHEEFINHTTKQFTDQPISMQQQNKKLPAKNISNTSFSSEGSSYDEEAVPLSPSVYLSEMVDEDVLHGAAKGAGGPHANKLDDFSIKRTLGFIAFPIADLLLFVFPSLHAHLRMAISTQFNYIVAPKFTAKLTVCGQALHKQKSLLAAAKKNPANIQLTSLSSPPSYEAFSTLA